MKFSEFFDEWLNSGYYKSGVSVGRGGDFFTSVSVGSLFGIILSKKILSLKARFSGEISIVEIGADRGYLLADIIQGIFTFDKDSLKDFKFVIIEPHDELKELQISHFKSSFGDEISLTHYKSLDGFRVKNAIFISNELIDTFPCEVIDGKRQLFIEDFKPVFRDAKPEILEFAKKHSIKKGEIPLFIPQFLAKIYKSSENFSFITFDYGYFGARNDFSLRVFKNHRVYNFFEIKGLREFYKKSDITYDLNFGVLKSEFLEFDGVKFESFKKQSVALVDMGAGEILDFILKNGGEIAYKNANLQLKRLLYELGERFYCIEFSKNLKIL